MKHFCLSLFFAYLLAACPNNCSGHGSCSASGTCTCNKQTGLALNGGAFSTFTYTGADCSHSIFYIYYRLGTCPLGTPFGTYKGVEKNEKEGYDGCNSAACRRVLGEMTVRFLTEDTESKTTPEASTTEATTTAAFPSLEKDLTNSSYTTWNISNPILPEMGSAGGLLMCRSSKTGKTAGKADVLSVYKSKTKNITYATIRFMFELTETPESEQTTTEEATTTTTTTTTTTAAAAEDNTSKRRLRNLAGEENNGDSEVEDATTEEEEVKTTPEVTTSAPTASPPPPPKAEGFNLQELECSVVELRNDLSTLVPEKVSNKTLTISEGSSTLPTGAPSDFPTINPSANAYQVIVWEGMKDILSNMGLFDKQVKAEERMRILINIPDGGKYLSLWCYDNTGNNEIKLTEYHVYIYPNDNDVYMIILDDKTPTNPGTCRLAATPNGKPVNITETEIGKNNGCTIKDDGKEECETITVPDTSKEDIQIVENLDGKYTISATSKTISEKAMKAIKKIYSNSENHYAFIPIPQSDDEYGNVLMKITEGAKLTYKIYNNAIPIHDSPFTVTVSSVLGTSFNLPQDIIEKNEEDSSTTTTTSEGEPLILAETLESSIINLPTVYTSELFNPLDGKNSYNDLSMKVEITESTTRSMMECSGQGTCNRETGQCECYAGYNGDACQRLSCPNDCSNHGRCVKVYEAIGQETVSYYSGYGNRENIYSCICDPGHRGSDCSLLECPSDKDPMKATNIDGSGTDEYRDCSGRGNCDYSTGLCGCFDGFYGEACQYASTYA